MVARGAPVVVGVWVGPSQVLVRGPGWVVGPGVCGLKGLGCMGGLTCGGRG
ncbi:Uncharacterised protein [Dermatophilus congolensis]|uniref:Uncharacterized protein n=1 Tax=Dermatophilus congolensis TaxID=1863 RepID=A0AA46GZI7_9MICO|nr:Uncharacterised protein [Dermatophilus congolensis]